MAKKEEESDIREGSSYDLAVGPPLDFSSNCCPRLVVNGLKLKYKSQDQKIPYKSFSYTPVIEYNNDLVPTDWQFLSADNVERDHIRIHELRDGDDLLKCAEQYQESHAKAMIVINTSEDYTLSPELSQPLQKFESLFVAILPRTDGTALLDCLQIEGIFAKLDVVSSEPEPFTENEHTVVSKATAEIESNIQPQARNKTKVLTDFKLKREILKVMFDDDRILPISMDGGRFQIIMSTFTQYEKMGKPNSSKVNKLIKKFDHFLEPSFQFEFPFFLILICKFIKFRKYYECDELVPFIKRCIIMSDELTPSEVSGILNSFFERKDFGIMFGQEETNISVFTVLADTCKSLMPVSIRLKKNHFVRGVLYSKLMWISVHLKFVGKKRGPRPNWDRDFVKTSREIQIQNDVISDLKLGLEVSNLLNLPLEYQFTTCHLARFLADEKCIRPLSHVRDVITGLETFIKSDEGLLVHLMTSLRIHYTELLKSSNKTFIKHASVEQTVQGTLNEGISFLDSMNELWCNKKWNEGDKHEHFRAECLEWMLLLLQTVHITDASTPELLNTFLVPEKDSMMADGYFQSHIANGILEVTTKCFPALTIQVFFPLYKAHAIWPISFLHEYLKQHPIPDTIRINDAIWSKFFTTILERFQGDEPQNHVADLLIRVANIYTNNRRASIFILDILQLKVTYLFSCDNDRGLDGSIVGGRFSKFLKGYIQQNNLCPKLMRRIQEIIGYILQENEQTAFQCIILNVLKDELIPDLTLLQKDDKQLLFEDLLKQVVKILCHKILEFKSPKLKFCWGIVTAACYKIPPTSKSFQWVCNLQDIIKEVGVVFNTYCDSYMLSNQQCLLTEALPVEIEHCPWDDVRQYFKWVQVVQDILRHWQNKFQRNDVNYDEIMMYASNIESINALSRAVRAAAYVLDEKDISTMKETFIDSFKQLNCYLLRYVPDHPEVKYCTLPELLLFYGVSFPPKLQETLQQRIIFPGNENRLLREKVVSLTSTEDSSSDQKLYLMVTGSFSLLDIRKLLEDLKSFLEPIADHMEMLVFFHLHKSEIFKKHLFKHLEDIMTAAKELQMTFMNFPSSIKPSPAITKQSTRQANDKGIPIAVLRQALDKVKDLLVKAIEGTATYSDIVASGTFSLETLNIKDEFTTLTKSSDILEVDRKGLDGVKCMLELFQFTSHIFQIEQVCEQYDLQCHKDEKLRKMLSMVEELKPEKSRDLLTPIEAKEKMAFIKEALCLKECMDYSCLYLFLAIADSAAFYQFIKDKMFVGPKGQAIFREQYQLITAHLQHEEYDENVLNNLWPAYQLIVPFMDTNISFCELMSKVIKMDTTSRLKQLKIVNENITLIRLWFSRAEGDTIENVVKELQDILSTGVFQLQLNGSSSILLIYKYQAMQSMPHQKKDVTTETSRVSNSDLIAGSESCQEHILEDSSNGTNGAKEEEDASLLSKDRSVERKWTSEQIADFVIKLGFKEKGGDKIQQFLHLNSTANKLLELCTKLFKLGHPCYQKDTDLPVVSCSTPATEADAMVNLIQQTLIKWQNQSTTLHQEYTWLLFFSVPKALHLYLLLERYQENPELHLDSIVLEVSVMFENKQNVRTKLKCVVQDAIKKTQKKMKGVIPREFLQNHKEMHETIPMEFLGEFLHQICESEELHTFLCKRRRTCCIGSTSQILSKTKSGSLVGDMYQLHYTPGYSQTQLICLITELYNGVPECYEMFHCRPSTTQEELHFFMERIKHHPLTYLVLQVNKMPFSLQELLISLLKPGDAPDSPQNKNKSSVHFIETSPSVLREVPWINYQEHKSDGPTLSLDEAGDQCRRVILHPADFTDIQLVYGHAGDGKTHYIRQQLAKSPAGLTVAINEAFTPLYAINHLNTLPHDVIGCAVFFNFTLMPYQEIQGETEKRKANELMETIGWFFYHFMILGYVEDPTTGASFRFPGGHEWAIYIEVPSLDRSHGPEESLQLFTKKFPTIYFLGSKHLIDPAIPITVDEDVQLVCKYLRAYKIGGGKGIDRLYQNRNRRIHHFLGRNVPSPIVKFSADPDLSDEECHQLLMKYMPGHVQETKITQKLFIRYMKKRCAFLDTLPAFNFNSGSGKIPTDKNSRQKAMTDTSQLGSTLMETMIEEASNFCDPDMKGNWAEKSHQQLIYDFHDGGSFGLLSLQPENIPIVQQEKYKKIGFELHSAGQLQKREILDQMLARALGLPSEPGKQLSIIDDCNYVLTPDYALKMLNIHERYSCGMPVVIKGETGVGKTALVEMLSQLWNNALLYQWYEEKEDIINTIHSKIVSIKEVLESYQTSLEIVKTIAIRKKISAQNLKTLRQLDDKDPTKLLYTSGLRELILQIEGNPTQIAAPLETTSTMLQAALKNSMKSYQTCLKIMEAITGEREVSVDEWMILEQMNDRDPLKRFLANGLRELLLDVQKNPAVALLEVPSAVKGQNSSLAAVFESTREHDTIETTATLLQAVLKAEIKNTFHKLNVHAALTPCEIQTFFEPIITQADILKEVYVKADESKKAKIKMPFITVFLDEVNTSSCLGLFKEIIVDKTLDGNIIPENIFIVAACNPYRDNSMATHAAETWIRSSYYVRPLHPTLEYLMWDYGSLDQYQERDYILAKMQICHKELPSINVVNLINPIVESQNLMRKYAWRQLTNQKMSSEEAEVACKSCVSQRDIQRVFTFYHWLMSVYNKLNRHGSDRKRRAVMVSLGIVYYMRLNNKYRKEYGKELNRIVEKEWSHGSVLFFEAFNDELNYFCESIKLPLGIAKTQALKENLFATIVCTVTHTPLVIVGAPGSSKTLSVNLTIANLKGPESKMDLFRDTEIFKSLDPHFYQCSRITTSNEIQTVFSRAINRQRSHARFSLPIYCVVFMDEAGLPEESHESLKVLHYHLDKQEVSFVAITNHVLDAAKTNRAVSLFRPEVSNQDLETLAKGCLTDDPENPPAHLKQDLDTIVQFCPVYTLLMKDPKLRHFFGQRDFIHFINYLRRWCTKGITPQLVIEALERNFNGVCWSDKDKIFQTICESFLKTMAPPITSYLRSILEVLKESLDDHPEGSRNDNEVRYKLIIDPTEDNSLMHLLIAFGVLDRKKTRIYVCSDFSGDSQIQKINVISAIRHSAFQGHTVVMSQTDDIHESFYDLFNQRFRKIDDPDPERSPHYYTNITIGAHLKPCRVHPDFSCVVVVKQTEVDTTPAPFLNRFEKYFISHETLLNTTLNHLNPCVRIILQTAREKVKEFINVIGGDNISIYGLKPQTLDSLLLSLLPPYGHTYKETPPAKNPISDDARIFLLHELLRALRNSAGFAIPACSTDELVMDTNHLFPLLNNDAMFAGVFDILTIETANIAVNEALHVLHTAPSPNEEGVVTTQMSQEACLVVSILQQWLIRHLCKTLMQLMTPEAICLHRKKIPASLIENYLTNQQHFSLKKLIKHHLLALENCHSSAILCPNKLLCFTRSSSIIHLLPTTYPHPAALKRNLSDEDVKCLEELIHDDPTRVQVCQVLSVQSQTAIQETLRCFIQEPTRRILLLMVNMQEATTEIVNHLRAMIEEADAQASSTSHKLFVLLLHFPPTMFFDPCYPSLFLREWNHYYLDSIGHSSALLSGKLDIEEWFQRCCFSDKEFIGDNLLEACNHLLTEVVPVLVDVWSASRCCYNQSTGPFTKDMTTGERSEKLKELLFKKKVGQKLCQMFRACCRPNVMTECLEQAARFTQSRESSLSISDALQSKFQSLFFDFMVVMVTTINTEHNLDVLFSQDHCSEVEKLFLLLLETINPPKLDQAKTLARSLAQPKPQQYQPRFPFFSMVCKRMKELIEDYRKVQNQKDNILEEHPEEDIPTVSYFEGMNSRMKDLADLVLTAIDNHFQKGEVPLSDPLFITLKCVRDHPDQLCDRYFSDFIYHSLHLDIVASPLSREFIHTFFSEFLQLPPLERLVYLHIYVDYVRINLANICSLLRPLEKIWEIVASSPQTLATEGSSPANDFIKVVSETNHPFGDPQKLSSFVISALFSALVGTKDEGINNGILKMWYRTYQSVMSMPALRSHLYMTSLPDTEEAKFNTMHTTFALMHVYPMVNKDVLMKGNKLFTKLLQKYFKANLQLKDSGIVPSLNDCSQIAGQLIVDDGNAQNFTQTLQEELFNHFLSPNKASYSSHDRDWFLRRANCQGTLKTSVYQRYLSLLLGCHSKNEDQKRYDFDAVKMYDPGARQSVANVLLKDGEEPGPYIPTFYQDCQAIKLSESSENLLMQQPLCHLYFATLMEHLMAKSHSINSLIQVAGTISQRSILESVSRGGKIVLQIEKQAVIQCLLQELASLYSKSTNPVQELAPIMDNLNNLLNDDITVGGAIRGYGLTLGMHLLHKLQSYRQFTELFTTRYHFIREIQCTNFFHEMLPEAQVESSPYFLPFMYDEDQASTLGKLYQQVKSAMLSIHETKGSQASVDQLLKVDDKCASYKNKPQDKLDRRQAFKMILWLVTYYELFAKKKSLHVLSTMIEQQMKCCRNDKGFVQLIKSFLTQGSLIEKKESSLMPQRDDTQPDGYRERVDHEGVDNADPLYDLFNPSSPKDQSDHDLCHCLANLVGVVLGCQPRSNHLWYHLFSPEMLKDTYMTGFMYDDKISPEGLLYDCGVELTSDGQYGRPDYLPHATRGTYSLHSLYFLLWANFGTLCVSMLTQPNSQSNIHGVLISDQRAIRHYCVSQVKSLWMNLKNNLSLSDEERSFLVTRCLMNLYETNMEPAGISLGMLKTKEKRDAYETFWHENVFTPAWKELHDKFKGLYQNQIFTNIHQLETRYPQYPSEWDFLNYIQGFKVGNDWKLLTRFVVEKQRLEVGGQLLPILIQLYQWLHTFLAHLVTPERASNKLMIGEVIELAARKVNPSLKELYQNVKGLYNEYVKLVGGAIGPETHAAVKRGNRICTIQDDIPLIHFLSGSEEDNGNDWLYAVIRDIAEAQNHFIHTLYTNVGDVETGEHHLARLLPQDHSYIYPHEANEHSCIVPKQKIHHGGLTEYLQLVRARLDACGQAKAALSHPSLSFNLTRLQEDIVGNYLSGKPIIQDISSLRTVFKFKQEKNGFDVNRPDSDPMGTAFDITVFRNDLPEEYQVPLAAQDSHLLECEFHSANYHVLTDIVIGLQTAMGFLMKVLTPDNSTSDQSLHTITLNDFIVSQYEVEESEQCQVLSQIGIKNVSGTQLRCLSSIKLHLLFSTLELFVGWVKEGLYDFSSLPMALKVHLTKDDLANLEQVPVDYSGTSASLLTELKGLVEVLLRREPYIVKEINEIARKPLMEVLDALVLGQLSNLIPHTVLVHHYVKFRMILRKLILITEQSVTMETSFQDINQKQWSETVDDLWSKALPHLRDKGFAFIDSNLLLSTTTGQYGFYGDNWEEEEETENELGGELNKDTSTDESSHKHQELPKISSKKKIDIEQEAKKWSPQKISQFLEECGKKEHVETFLDEGIDGPQLLNAARDIYRDLGVTSGIGYVQIAVLFKRELMGVETIHCSVSDLIKSNERLARHEKTLQEAGVDGDMLKFAQQNDFLAELLQDIGIPKYLDRLRFDTALKGYKHYSTTV